jgi:hypothetical protein
MKGAVAFNERHDVRADVQRQAAILARKKNKKEQLLVSGLAMRPYTSFKGLSVEPTTNRQRDMHCFTTEKQHQHQKLLVCHNGNTFSLAKSAADYTPEQLGAMGIYDRDRLMQIQSNRVALQMLRPTRTPQIQTLATCKYLGHSLEEFMEYQKKFNSAGRNNSPRLTLQQRTDIACNQDQLEKARCQFSYLLECAWGEGTKEKVVRVRCGTGDRDGQLAILDGQHHNA